MTTQTIDRNIIFKEETIVSERVKYIMLEKNKKESWIQGSINYFFSDIDNLNFFFKIKHFT